MAINPYVALDALNSNDYITINKKLAAHFGGNWNKAVFVSYLIGQRRYFAQNGQLTSDGFFYSCAKKVLAEIFTAERTQTRYLDELKQKGWINTEQRDKDGKRYIFFTLKMCKDVARFLGSDYAKIAEPITPKLPNRLRQNCRTDYAKTADLLDTNLTKEKELTKEKIVCEKSAGAKKTHTQNFSEKSESETEKSPIDASEEKRKKVAAKKEKFLQMAAEVAKQEEFVFLAKILDDTKKAIWGYFQTASDWEKTPTKVWVRNQFSKVCALVKDYSEKGVREEIARCQGNNFQQIAYSDNKELQKYKRQNPWQPTANTKPNPTTTNKAANESPTTEKPAEKTDYRKTAEEHFIQTKKAQQQEQVILTSLQDLEKLAKENNINFQFTDKGDIAINATKLARVLTISNFAGIASDLVKKAVKNDFLALCENNQTNPYPMKAFSAVLEFLAHNHINRNDGI